MLKNKKIIDVPKSVSGTGDATLGAPQEICEQIFVGINVAAGLIPNCSVEHPKSLWKTQQKLNKKSIKKC
jgi:hypothetical protein